MKLDHLAITCRDLETGRIWAKQRLRTTFQSGGKHAHFGTHNLLLGLGPDFYLEIICPDPDAQIDHPRWFNLDHATDTPQLGNWICAVPDLDQALAEVSEAGQRVDLQRNDLKWSMAVPRDGSLPYQGAFPSLIEWGKGTTHPGNSLPDSGLRLRNLTVSHPDMGRIQPKIALNDPCLTLKTGPLNLSAIFDHPDGGQVTL